MFSPFRFPNLSELSLAFPSSNLSSASLWARLPAFISESAPQLTHLSLAGWPPPAETSPYFIRFCQITLCLKSIDISYCSWVEMLQTAPWDSAWRSVKSVIAKGIDERTLRYLHRTIAQKRRAIGGWVEINEGR
jgi:hypothetical protein